MAAILHTQFKLKEAEFFLRKLSDKRSSAQLDSEEFRYYLSAYLNAARPRGTRVRSWRRSLGGASRRSGTLETSCSIHSAAAW